MEFPFQESYARMGKPISQRQGGLKTWPHGRHDARSSVTAGSLAALPWEVSGHR
jgi:hypothetical protein